MTRTTGLNRDDFQLLPDIRGEDDEDTALLRGMAEEARDFVTAHDWCPPIRNLYLATGVGAVVALFLVDFAQQIPGSEDDSLWLVVGDLPFAYFVTENSGTPREALETYCRLMDEWIVAVANGGDLGEAYPVEAEPSIENARELQSRVDFLRTEIIPAIS
jgi:hypothetical protein